MLTGLTLALTILGGAPGTLVATDTVGPETLPAHTLAPTLQNVYPQRFGGSGGMVMVRWPGDALPQRAKAVQHSDFYYTRLKIHRAGAILMVPLIVAQYFAGQELYQNGTEAAQWAQDLHRPLAATIGVVYGVNAVTGIWNAIDDWGSPGRARRTVHGALMLLAGAGFVAVGATAPEREGGEYEDGGNASQHRTLAISSMAVMAASGIMMLIWK